MAQNPLFHPDPSSSDTPDDESLLAGEVTTGQAGPSNPAVELIRQKVANLYVSEPNAKQEMAEAEVIRPRSRHQQFMYELSSSGKGLAEIQTAWHNYYVALPDDEKHQVWQEFYEANERSSA